eukprot:TRINITY_DN3956_c2_g1_i1.p1 TRINITY_DN3956_c2_g1~~TRINITY_DN3956_c2_g1_i1.p1  ORF type:complete len:594 (+),score=185.93 TRINITY_DN3956_c2_g1_i1:211-1992(+)
MPRPVSHAVLPPSPSQPMSMPRLLPREATPPCPPPLVHASESPASRAPAEVPLKLLMGAEPEAPGTEGPVSDETLSQWLVDMVSTCAAEAEQPGVFPAAAPAPGLQTPLSAGKKLVFQFYTGGSRNSAATPGSRGASIEADGGQSVAVRVAGQVIATPGSHACERKRLFAGHSTPAQRPANLSTTPGTGEMPPLQGGSFSLASAEPAPLPPLLPQTGSAPADSPPAFSPVSEGSPDPAHAPSTAKSLTLDLSCASPPGLCIDPATAAEDDEGTEPLASPESSPPGLEALEEDDVGAEEAREASPPPSMLVAADDDLLKGSGAATSPQLRSPPGLCTAAATPGSTPPRSPPGLCLQDTTASSPASTPPASPPGLCAEATPLMCCPPLLPHSAAPCSASPPGLCEQSRTPARSPPALCADEAAATPPRGLPNLCDLQMSATPMGSRMSMSMLSSAQNSPSPARYVSQAACVSPARSPALNAYLAQLACPAAPHAADDDAESVLSVDFRSKMRRGSGSSPAASRSPHGAPLALSSTSPAATPLPPIPALCEASASPVQPTPPPLLPCPTPSPADPRSCHTTPSRRNVGDTHWSLRN